MTRILHRTCAALVVAALPVAAFATSWEECRQLGLSSALDCQRYDNDPAFRAMVNRANGLDTYRPAPSAPPPPPDYQPTRKCTDDRDFNCIKKW